jgi:hypothetical protein
LCDVSNSSSKIAAKRVLVWESGIGKSAILDELYRRLTDGDQRIKRKSLRGSCPTWIKKFLISKCKGRTESRFRAKVVVVVKVQQLVLPYWLQCLGLIVILGLI